MLTGNSAIATISFSLGDQQDSSSKEPKQTGLLVLCCYKLGLHFIDLTPFLLERLTKVGIIFMNSMLVGIKQNQY